MHMTPKKFITILIISSIMFIIEFANIWLNPFTFATLVTCILVVKDERFIMSFADWAFKMIDSNKARKTKKD